MSETLTPWNKGLSNETDSRVAASSEKQRQTRLGVPHGHKTNNGNPSWNKGLRYKEDSPQLLLDVDVPKAKYEGSRHWKWKGGITNEDKYQRAVFVKYHSKKIFERDNFTCQICGTQQEVLHADHIKSWAEFPELRFEHDNCRTLCRICHYKITFGKPMPEGSRWGLKSVPKNLGA